MIDLYDRYGSSSQNCFLKKNEFKKFKFFKQILNKNFKNASPPSILNGFGFCLFCWIDLDTGHKTYLFVFLNFKCYQVEIEVFIEISNNLKKRYSSLNYQHILILLIFTIDMGLPHKTYLFKKNEFQNFKLKQNNILNKTSKMHLLSHLLPDSPLNCSDS